MSDAFCKCFYASKPNLKKYGENRLVQSIISSMNAV